jgi:hypothetical protein
MRTMQRIAAVSVWLDRINALPLGHPDRLQFLSYAEELLAAPSQGSARHRAGEAVGPAAQASDCRRSN